VALPDVGVPGIGDRPAMSTASDPTLRDRLQRDRLAHRERRLEAVLIALRRRADDHDHVPVPLREAISGFRDELDAVRRQLRRASRFTR